VTGSYWRQAVIRQINDVGYPVREIEIDQGFRMKAIRHPFRPFCKFAVS
jgi:hypothetical protein